MPKKVDSSHFRHTSERKKQYIASERYVRRAVLRRGLDNAYAIKPEEVKKADEAVSASRSYQVTTEEVATGMKGKAKKLGLAALDAGTGYKEVVQAGQNFSEDASLGNFMDLIHSSVKMGKTLESNAISGLSAVTTIAGMDVAKKIVGGPIAGVVAVADGIKNVVISANAFDNAEHMENYVKKIKIASGDYDVSTPAVTLAKIREEQTNFGPYLEYYEAETKKLEEEKATTESANQRPNLDKELETSKIIRDRYKHDMDAIKDAGNIFMKSWNMIRLIEAATAVQKQEGTSKAISAIGNVIQAVGAVATTTGVGATVGMIFTAASVAVSAVNFMYNFFKSKSRSKKIVTEEQETKNIVQEQVLAASKKEGEEVFAGKHKGLYAGDMMKNLDTDKFVQDIIDEVYTHLEKHKAYRKKLRTTKEGKDEHGKKVTEAYQSMIFYEMGVVSGDKSGLADAIQSQKSVDLLIQAGQERNELYKIREHNKKEAKKKTPSYQSYPTNGEPTVRFLEQTSVKKKKDNLSPENIKNADISGLPTLNETAKGYGSNADSVANLVKKSEVNPFVKEWKQDLEEKGDGGLLSVSAHTVGNGIAGAWHGFTSLFDSKETKAKKANREMMIQEQERVESERIARKKERRKEMLDEDSVTKKQRLAGRFAVQAQLGRTQLGDMTHAAE